MSVRLLAACLALIAAGCGSGTGTSDLPDWLEGEISGLTFEPAAGDFPVSATEAEAEARSTLALPDSLEMEPTSVPVLVSGVVVESGPISGSGEPPKRQVARAPAWVLVWRGLDPDTYEPAASDDPAAMDLLVVVDANTGEVLTNIRLFGPNRIE